MTTNRETSFKTVSDFIDLGYFQLICQMLAKFSGVKSERTVFKFRKNNKKICCVHLVYKVNAWNWEVSRRSRATSAKKCTKKFEVLALLPKLIAFLAFSLPSPSSLLKLHIVLIQKLCYHGNMTSHFSLFCNTFCKSNHNIHYEAMG